jgi:regulatory protein YycI of two-component signal transduction system YycFG
VDWSKAKSILIVVLLLLNIFLVVSIGFYKTGESISRETVSNTVDILSSRGVTVDVDIPLYNSYTPSLICEGGGYDTAAIAAKLFGENFALPADVADGEEIVSGSKKFVFDNRSSFTYSNSSPSDILKVDDVESAEDAARSYMKLLEIDVSDFELDRYVENQDASYTLTFIEKYQKFFVYDNYIDITLGEDGVSYLAGHSRKIKGFNGNAMPIMPAYQILLKNYSGNEDVKIVGIDIGFKGYITEEQNMQESSEGPAWRITCGNGKVRYFKASDGEEIR